MAGLGRALAVLLVVLTGGLTATVQPAHALIEIDVNRGNVEPMPIAIPSFVGDPKFGPDISGVIGNNLRRSGLFRPLPPFGTYGIYLL